MIDRDYFGYRSSVKNVAINFNEGKNVDLIQI